MLLLFGFQDEPDRKEEVVQRVAASPKVAPLLVTVEPFSRVSSQGLSFLSRGYGAGLRFPHRVVSD